MHWRVYGIRCRIETVGCKNQGVEFGVSGGGWRDYRPGTLCHDDRDLLRLRAVEPDFHMKRDLIQNLSGNEVYHTNSVILPVKNMLCT